MKHLHRLISDGASTSKRLIWPGEQSVCAAVDTVHAKEFFTWNSTRSSTHGEKTRFRPVMSAWQMWKNLEKCRPIIKRMKPSNEPSLVDFSKPPPFISLARILKLQSFRNSQKKIEKKKLDWKKNIFPLSQLQTGRKKMRKILRWTIEGTFRRSWQLSKARASRTPEVSSKAWILFAVQLVYKAIPSGNLT